MKSELKRFCPRCKSDQITKSGKHQCLKGIIQRFQCKICGTTFSNDGYYRGKHALSIVQYSALLYQQGFSYEKIQIKIKENFGISISRVTIGNWIKKLRVQPRIKSSGDQKHKVTRDLIELGVSTVVRYADTFHPEKFIILDNFVTAFCEKNRQH